MTPAVFVIHHLTDIHIGFMHYSPNAPDWFKDYTPGTFNIDRYIKYLEESRTHIPDLLVISGDLTSLGTQREMRVALEKLYRLLDALKQKESPWRKEKKPDAPYIVMVPGNHDLNWEKDTHKEKIEEFGYIADSLYGAGVLSSTYQHEGGPVCFDFGEEANLFVYLLDSTALGGIKDSTFQNIYEQIATNQRRIVDQLQAGGRASSDQDAAKELESTLEALKKAARKDPGYVETSALEKMKQKLLDVPASRLKVAVLHHNPTSVPSDDIDQFDVLINAGRLKQELLRSGFDVALYGHRHFFHCSQERSPSYDYDPKNAAVSNEILFLAGDSLGCKQEGPFLELSLRDLPAHQLRPPVCLLSAYTWRYVQDGYKRDADPVVQSILSTPIHRALDRVARNIGRTDPLPSDKDYLAQDIATVLSPIQELQSRLVDWSADTVDWIQKFHNQMKFYFGIYATDLSSERSSLQNPRFKTYLRQQYVARRRRLPEEHTATLYFSPEIYHAIQRTNWCPSDLCFGKVKIGSHTDPSKWGLEIARILIRPLRDLSDEDCEMLSGLDFDHKLFGIPLFIIDQSVLRPDQIVDIAVAKDDSGQILRGFRYYADRKKVDETSTMEEAADLLLVFEEILKHPNLNTVDAVLKQREPAMKIPRSLG